MPLNHTTPVNATAAFDVSLTFLCSVPTDIFPIDMQWEKVWGLVCNSCMVQNKGLLQLCWLCPE